MNTYKAVLVKSYIVEIKAENKEEASKYVELYTGDIKDISTIQDREKFSFEITNIDVQTNEVIEIIEKL
jgi:predicted small secreted protein